MRCISMQTITDRKPLIASNLYWQTLQRFAVHKDKGNFFSDVHGVVCVSVKVYSRDPTFVSVSLTTNMEMMSLLGARRLGFTENEMWFTGLSLRWERGAVCVRCVYVYVHPPARACVYG